MADLTPLNFNPAETEDMGDGFRVYPPNTYPVVIVESDVIDTKAGDGKILYLKNQFIEGPETGNIIDDRINIKNKSEIAEKIGKSQLKNICDAVGFAGQLTDSGQLHGKRYSIKVGIKKFKSNKPDSTGNFKELEGNEITKRMPYQPFNASLGTAQVGSATSAAGHSTTSPAAGKVAW